MMVEKGIKGAICAATHRYAKANDKYNKNCDKNRINHVSCIQMQTVFQKLPVNGFKMKKSI